MIFIIFSDVLKGTDSCESSGKQRGDGESFRVWMAALPVTAATFGRTQDL